MPATLIGFLAVVLWSCLALLTTASGPVPPFELATLTFAIGGLAGLLVTAARGRLALLRQPWRVWSVGVGGLFGYHALYFAALQTALPAQAGLIAYLWPLLIVLFSATLPGETLHRRHVAGAVLGLAGVAILLFGARDGRMGFETRSVVGYALAFCCALVWAAYSVLSRRLRDVPTDAVAGFCCATAVLAGLAHGVFERTVWPSPPSALLAVCALGLGPVGLAFYVWDYGLKRGDIRLLGVLSYAAPVMSTCILVACGYAQASPALGFACAMIVAGAITASWRPLHRQSLASPSRGG